MEKLAESYDKEDMKMAMIKHEETFRQQVYELHRLYRIQKILMKNIKIKNEVFLRQKLEVNLEEEARGKEMIEESEIELTLGPSSYNQRRKKSVNSDSGPSFSSSSTGSSQGNKIFMPRTREQFNDGGSEMGFVGFVDVEEQIRLRQNNPWLYQVVSLNLT